jgi:drug/metabolite transporter (DMT)-like permease
VGSERIGALQVLGTGLALIGALLIVTRGDPQALLGMRAAKGDLLMLMAMLGWSGYTLMQSRAASSGRLTSGP